MNREMLLEIRSASKSFSGLKAVDDVSLRVDQGSIVGLIGPNGSGKSTLFNLISGLETLDKGEITFNNVRIDKLSPNQIFEKGIIRSFQTPRVYSGLTVEEDFLVPPPEQLGEKPWNAPLKKKWSKQEIELVGVVRNYLTRFRLDKVRNNWGRELSGGQMKLTDVGRTLMGKPRLLLLDEPTAGVAPNTAMEIFDHLEKINSESGVTLFIIEHRLEILFSIVSKVYVMNLGKIISEGTPAEITRDQQVIEAYLGK